MAIDFTMPAHVHEIRDKVRAFIKEEIEPAEAEMAKTGNWREGIIELRRKARQRGLWLPHMPKEFGGLGLDAMAIAVISAECGRTRLASFILNVQAPDEGNMHTLLHFATPAQKEKYLRPLCDGKIRSCFAMTEPEAAGSDPTQIKTSAVKQGDNWVINGHKWFISGAHGAKFAIVMAKTDPDADPPQARNSAFIVDLPNLRGQIDGLNQTRIQDVLLQPYIGFWRNFTERAYFHSFNSIAVPTVLAITALVSIPLPLLPSSELVAVELIGLLYWRTKFQVERIPKPNHAMDDSGKVKYAYTLGVDELRTHAANRGW